MEYSINVSLKSVPIFPKERGALVEPGGTVTEKGLFWLHNAHQWLRTSAFSKIYLLLSRKNGTGTCVKSYQNH